MENINQIQTPEVAIENYTTKRQEALNALIELENARKQLVNGVKDEEHERLAGQLNGVFMDLFPRAVQGSVNFTNIGEQMDIAINASELKEKGLADD